MRGSFINKKKRRINEFSFIYGINQSEKVFIFKFIHAKKVLLSIKVLISSEAKTRLCSSAGTPLIRFQIFPSTPDQTNSR